MTTSNEKQRPSKDQPELCINTDQYGVICMCCEQRRRTGSGSAPNDGTAPNDADVPDFENTVRFASVHATDPEWMREAFQVAWRGGFACGSAHDKSAVCTMCEVEPPTYCASCVQEAHHASDVWQRLDKIAAKVLDLAKDCETDLPEPCAKCGEAICECAARSSCPNPMSAIGAVNGLLGIDGAITHKGDQLKCYTRDIEEGGVSKTYLGASECHVLARAFAALAAQFTRSTQTKETP